jgi:hypothetical protein
MASTKLTLCFVSKQNLQRFLWAKKAFSILIFYSVFWFYSSIYLDVIKSMAKRRCYFEDDSIDYVL